MTKIEAGQEFMVRGRDSSPSLHLVHIIYVDEEHDKVRYRYVGDSLVHACSLDAFRTRIVASAVA